MSGKSTGTIRRDSCEDDKLMNILATLQIIDPENIVRLANKRDLATFCKNVGLRLKSAYDYMKNCSLASRQRMYANLIDGVESLYETICLNEEYRRAFESHSNCFKKLYSEFDNCAGPKDWVEDRNVTRLCKAYQNIVDCYMIKAALICGPDAADIFKKLLVNVFRATIVADCGIYSRSINKRMAKPMLSERAFYFLHLTIIFILIIILIFIHIKKN